MHRIQGLLLEPVGCLAEFPPGPFHEITVRVFGRKSKASPSASRTYWHLLNLLEAIEAPLTPDQLEMIESLELEAVEQSHLYEDVAPALAQLKTMGIELLIASSLSGVALHRFIERNGLADLFTQVWSRDEANGLKATPLVSALHAASLPPESAIFLTDTVEGIHVARAAETHPFLMMNDPDEAQRLATYNPAGGVVSFHEIPDFIRFVAAQKRA